MSTWTNVPWPVSNHRRVVLCSMVLYCVIIFVWCCLILYSILLCCIVVYCLVLHCFALWCIVLYCVLLFLIVLFCCVFSCIVLHCLYCVVLYCFGLCCIVFYCVVCIVLYHVVLFCIALCFLALCCIVVYYAVMYCVMLLVVVLFGVVWWGREMVDVSNTKNRRKKFGKCWSKQTAGEYRGLAGLKKCWSYHNHVKLFVVFIVLGEAPSSHPHITSYWRY